MRLYDEIFKSVEGVAFARCTIVPGGGGYFEGVKTVGDFSSERVVVYFPREEIEVLGEGLGIKKYCDGDLQISGRVYAVKVLSQTPSKRDGETVQGS